MLNLANKENGKVNKKNVGLKFWQIRQCKISAGKLAPLKLPSLRKIIAVENPCKQEPSSSKKNVYMIIIYLLLLMIITKDQNSKSKARSGIIKIIVLAPPPTTHEDNGYRPLPTLEDIL